MAIIGQGSFIVPATIVNQIIAIPSGVDTLRVMNYTRAGTIGGAARFGFEYYWQRGMAAATGQVKFYANAGAIVTGDTLLTGGFTLYDPSGQTEGSLPLIGNPVATTASTDAVRPVISTASTAGISIGTVVRVSGTGQTDVNGVDMVVGAFVPNTSITLLTATNALATPPGIAGVDGFYRIINVNSLFYPRRLTVVNITRAVNANVGTAIAHGLTPGQAVRFHIPAVSGMIQLNPTVFNNYQVATIMSVVDDYNFTIDIDTLAFTPFTWPTAVPNQLPVSFPQVVPVGANTAEALVNIGSQVPRIGGIQIPNTGTGILADATTNTGILGMVLGLGGLGSISGAAITGPAGSVAGDRVYWVAGKSDFGGL